MLADLLRGGENRLLQHVLELLLFDLAILGVAQFVANPPGERFVAAMLAPGLGDGFEFDVGRIAVERLEIIADRLHLDERKIKLAL